MSKPRHEPEVEAALPDARERIADEISDLPAEAFDIVAAKLEGRVYVPARGGGKSAASRALESIAALNRHLKK